MLRASDDVRDSEALRASDDVRDSEALRAPDDVQGDRVLRASDGLQGGKALRVLDDRQRASVPEAGITLYSCENEHYEAALIRRQGRGTAVAGISDARNGAYGEGSGAVHDVPCGERNACAQGGWEVILRLNIGGIKHIQAVLPIPTDSAKLIVRGENTAYHFFVETGEKELYLGTGEAKYLSSEVVEGFTGVMIGCYAVGDCRAEFSKLRLVYETGAGI
ncbi:MAG: hypothetical protein NC254_07260 [bacterium]|nr:hypothetical protein [bacterium]